MRGRWHGSSGFVLCVILVGCLGGVDLADFAEGGGAADGDVQVAHGVGEGTRSIDEGVGDELRQMPS